MSLANARKHWRFLVGLVLLFVAVAVAGPLLAYGLDPLFMMLFDGPGLGFVLLFGLIFTIAVLGWTFGVPWAGDKFDHLTLDRLSNDGSDDARG